MSKCDLGLRDITIVIIIISMVEILKGTLDKVLDSGGNKYYKESKGEKLGVLKLPHWKNPPWKIALLQCSGTEPVQPGVHLRNPNSTSGTPNQDNSLPLMRLFKIILYRKSKYNYPLVNYIRQQHFIEPSLSISRKYIYCSFYYECTFINC